MNLIYYLRTYVDTCSTHWKGLLASASTEAKNAFILDEILPNYPAKSFLGLESIGDGIWYWSNHDVTSWTNWDVGSPGSTHKFAYYFGW